MVSRRSLSDSKSLQVSRTLLSILNNLYNAVVWMVSTLPIIFKSLYQSFRAPLNNWHHRHFYVPQFFFNYLARSRYLSFLSFSFNFTLWSAGIAEFCLFSFIMITWCGRLAKIKLSVCISKSLRSLYVLFSKKDSGLCKYLLVARSNLNFLRVPSGHYFVPVEFFALALADCLSQESEG